VFTLYRRHARRCSHAAKGVNYTRCDCPVWCEGRIDGQRIRRSLHARSWSSAERNLAQIEEDPRTAQHRFTLAGAIIDFFADLETRKICRGTRLNYMRILGCLATFCEAERISLVSQIHPDVLMRLRNGRRTPRDQPLKQTTQAKELASLRAFFHWCVDAGLITSNPARALRLPQAQIIPTLPFDTGEVRALLAARWRLDNHNQIWLPRARLRARALILLLLHSGLRVSDGVGLRRAAVRDGRLTLRTAKTGASVSLILPAQVLAALDALPRESDLYFFWNGRCALQTAVGSFRHTLITLGKLAGVAHVHPHRFRDTFACRLLESGADLRTVQHLLGHTSVRTTEKHYAPFVASHQRLLDAAVARMESLDDVPAPRLVDALKG
jgi:site-specific recombinase XerD